MTLVETGAEFAQLRQAWDGLHRTAKEASVFTSWEWQYHWWDVYGEGRLLHLVLVHEGERLLGVLPLYLDQQRVWTRFEPAVLRFVGTGGDTSPDDLGAILAPDTEEPVATAMADFVLTGCPGWDVLLLTDMHPASVFSAALEKQCQRARLPTIRGRSVIIPYLQLPPTWGAYTGSLTGRRRWRLRHYRRKLEAQGPIHFFVWESVDGLDGAFDRLAELHRKRWQAVGRPHSFSSPEYLRFHRRVMKACLERGWLRLYCLELRGQIIAMYYFYRFRSQLFLMQGGFDPAYAHFRPGHVLMGFAIEHAIAEGNRVLDFLRGDHRYKNELATANRETTTLTAYRRTASALAYRAAREYVPAVKGTAKALLRRLGLWPAAERH